MRSSLVKLSMIMYLKIYSFTFEACCKTESLVKEESMQNLRLNYYIEAETYTGAKKFSRVWFGASNNARPHYINRTVTLDTTKLVHCQKEIVYLKVKIKLICYVIFIYYNTKHLPLLVII